LRHIDALRDADGHDFGYVSGHSDVQQHAVQSGRRLDGAIDDVAARWKRTLSSPGNVSTDACLTTVDVVAGLDPTVVGSESDPRSAACEFQPQVNCECLSSVTP
jgi:hypothetical protein